MKVPLKAIWLKRWINTETLWNKKEVSRSSPEIAARRLLISTKNDKPREQMGPSVSTATGTKMCVLLLLLFIIIIIMDLSSCQCRTYLPGKYVSNSDKSSISYIIPINLASTIFCPLVFLRSFFLDLVSFLLSEICHQTAQWQSTSMEHLLQLAWFR